MKAVDTNVLVYAEITNSVHHSHAIKLLSEFAQGSAPWAIPWPCVYEFLRIITHPKVYHPPVSIDVALRDLNSILASPSLSVLAETGSHPAMLERVVRQSAATGNLIHDAHIVALCLEHGVTELLTADRDFTRFSGLKIKDPFV
ncbi:MAG: VapC toxin family PIN domain ribonuclease [Acidobacteria bacterium]|nr:MAG: VapC toxin family PIN domain ribonuclease [Acidobacteriota bacterium]